MIYEEAERERERGSLFSWKWNIDKFGWHGLKRVGVQFFVPNFCTPNRWTTLSSFVPTANDRDPRILFLPSRISPAHYRLMALPLAKSINEEAKNVSNFRFEPSSRSSLTIVKVNAFSCCVLSAYF